jgi:ribosome recycling factor
VYDIFHSIVICTFKMKLFALFPLTLLVLSFCLYAQAFTNRRSIFSQQYVQRSSTKAILSMEFLWKPVKKQADDQMSKSLQSIQTQFNSLRAAGANPSILDRVFVEYFGTSTPLNQVARVAASGSQQLIVDPFDKSALKDIEKAIAVSGLNLTPNSDGNVIRINIPALTEERRKDLVKQAKGILEDGKVAIRNARRDIVEKIKAAEKSKDISKDDSKDFQVKIEIACMYILLY